MSQLRPPRPRRHLPCAIVLDEAPTPSDRTKLRPLPWARRATRARTPTQSGRARGSPPCCAGAGERERRERGRRRRDHRRGAGAVPERVGEGWEGEALRGVPPLRQGGGPAARGEAAPPRGSGRGAASARHAPAAARGGSAAAAGRGGPLRLVVVLRRPAERARSFSSGSIVRIVVGS